jgi:hypothetical protein
MDGQRFDDLARFFGRRTSRRAVLRGAAGATVAGALGYVGAQSTAAQDTCDEGLTTCDGECVDLMTDLENCGACGSVCESGLVAVNCIQGQCVRVSCPAALPMYCGELGENDPNYVDNCIDPLTDPNNCGACGNVCASGVCADSVCAEGATPVPVVTPEEDDSGPSSLPSTGSGSAIDRPGVEWAPLGIASVAMLAAAAVRKAFPRRKVEE